MPNNHRRNNGTARNNRNKKNGNGGRILDDWISGYLDYTAEQESPSMFHTWVGLSVLGSALGRRVWVNRGYYRLYPNLYVVLVGASARVRKTTALNTGYKLFREALPDATIVSQKVTPEALIGIFVEKFKERQVSGGSVVSAELGVLLGSSKGSSDIMQLLTDWYDCPDYFEYHTLMRGKERMENVYCNMLAATTPQWLKDAMPPHAVGGGFTSRIVFVYQEEPEKLVPFPEVDAEAVKLKHRLVADLQAINELRGEYKLTEQAKEWYEDWYMKVFRPEKTPTPTLDGYFGRKHDTLLKVALLLSASKSNNRVIDELELRTALKAMNQNEKMLPYTLRLIQMTEMGEEIEKVHRAVMRRGEVDHTTLMRALSYCISSKRLEEVITELISADRLEQFKKGGKMHYKTKAPL